MRQLCILLRKDLQLELRAKETIILLFGVILTLSAIVSSGVASAFIEPPVVMKLYPTLLWTVFFFASALSSSRAYEHEIELRAFEGIVMSGACDWMMYISKVVSAGSILFCGYFMSVVVLAILTDISIGDRLLPLAVLGLLVTIGYNALSALLVAIASTSKLRGAILPLLLLPLIFPLFFAAIELTFEILSGTGLSISSPWMSLIVGFDVIFLVAGINLYRFALYD